MQLSEAIQHCILPIVHLNTHKCQLHLCRLIQFDAHFIMHYTSIRAAVHGAGVLAAKN